MEKYKQIKLTSKGAIRELAKLFLNNLYGKLASSTDSSFKVAYDKGNGVIGFRSVHANEKQAGYIPCGSAITSYSRAFTINAAQANFHGVDKPGFIYADTDSIHCDLQPEELKGIKVHGVNFCHWSLESQWDEAFFTRQKTYIEHVVVKDGEPCEPYYDIKCAGMPKKCKTIFELSMKDVSEDKLQEFDVDVQEFIKDKKTLEDFKVGLELKGKLLPKRISGGVVLLDTTYKMR